MHGNDMYRPQSYLQALILYSLNFLKTKIFMNFVVFGASTKFLSMKKFLTLLLLHGNLKPSMKITF